jgi:hypothetical protein
MLLGGKDSTPEKPHLDRGDRHGTIDASHRFARSRAV